MGKWRKTIKIQKNMQKKRIKIWKKWENDEKYEKMRKNTKKLENEGKY